MTRTAKIVTVLAALAAIVSGVLYGKGLLNVHQAAAKPASLAVLTLDKSPKAAPDVTFADAGGAGHRLSAFKGRYVLLNMWATWCGPCVQELPSLARLKGAAPGLLVVAVDMTHGDKPENAAAFLKGHNAALLGSFVDDQVSLMAAFRVAGLPTTVLIDPEGKVIARAEGPAEWGGLESVDYFKTLTGS